MIDTTPFKRKKNSLYSKSFIGAIHATEDLQSEQLPNYLPFYVGEKLLDKIDVKQNQLIFGRRGTGKSHLLGAFDEHINSRQDQTLSFFISCTGFTVTPEKIEFSDEKDRRDKLTNFFFRTFLQNLQDEFFKKYLPYCERHFKPRLSNGKYLEKRDSIEDLILRLADEINNGSKIEVIEQKVESSNLKTLERRSELSFFGKLSLDISQLFLSLGLGRKKSETKNVVKKKSEFLTTDYNKLRELISQIVDELEVKRLYICIDEWSELDRSSLLSIQPHFGHRLKHLLFNHKKISVKIASIWHDTRLLERGVDHKTQKGLEIGQDIHIGIELDTTNLKSEIKVRSFFANLLFERFKYYIPELEEIKKNDAVDTFFIDELFDDENNFNALVAASHGVPRDFLSLFNKCVYIINRKFDEFCIHKNLVREVAVDSYKKDKRSLIANHDYLKPYLIAFDEHIEKTGRRFFLTPNSEVGNNGFSALTDKKIIQQIPSSLTPRYVRNAYKVFYLDYGNYFEWIQVNRIESSLIHDYTVVVKYPDDFKDNFADYVLDKKHLSQNFMCCPHCNKYFSRSHKVFKKKNICPNCAEDISETDPNKHSHE